MSVGRPAFTPAAGPPPRTPSEALRGVQPERRARGRDGVGPERAARRTAEMQGRLATLLCKETFVTPCRAYPFLMKPSRISQFFATWCGSCPSTSTLAFSSCATPVVSRLLSGSNRPAICGYLSKVAVWTMGAAL